MTAKDMPSFKGMTPSKDEELGRVQIAPEVLEVIIGIATNEIEGVAHTRGNFAKGVAERFGITKYGKGVKINWVENGLQIDINCVVLYGYSVREVAYQIQRHVRHTIYNMTSLKTDEINVHVTGIEKEAIAES